MIGCYVFLRGEFPYAEERSVQSLLVIGIISTRISVNWLIHREAPGTTLLFLNLNGSLHEKVFSGGVWSPSFDWMYSSSS